MTAINVEYSEEYLQSVVLECTVTLPDKYILNTNDLIKWMGKKAIPLKKRAKLMAEAQNYVNKLNRNEFTTINRTKAKI